MAELSRFDADLFTRNLHYTAAFWEEHRDNMRALIEKMMNTENIIKLYLNAARLCLTFNEQAKWIPQQYNREILFHALGSSPYGTISYLLYSPTGCYCTRATRCILICILQSSVTHFSIQAYCNRCEIHICIVENCLISTPAGSSLPINFLIISVGNLGFFLSSSSFAGHYRDATP
jgi:hypothetical protein